MEAAADYVCHMSDEFGSLHLNQTVLPNTVSYHFLVFRNVLIGRYFHRNFEKNKLFKMNFQLHMYRTVHQLMPAGMSDETYQTGWISAACSVGITESMIQKLAALARN